MRLFIFCLIAIGIIGCKGETETKQAVKEKPKTAQKPKAVELSPDMLPNLQKLLQKATQMELLFHFEGYSMTSDNNDPKSMNAFLQYVGSEIVPENDCDFDGSIVMRSGDDIIIEADFVMDPSCAYWNLKMDGKTYRQKITNNGFTYLKQFEKMMQQQGLAPAN